MISRLAGPAALALLAIAGAAHAEAAPEPIPATPVLDLSMARTAARASYAQAAALQSAGIAQTSVDRSVAGGGLSLGFLCGLQPAYYHAGAADARGYDPQGKFVGAKLAFAFK